MNGIEQTIDYLEGALRQFPGGALRLVLTALLGLIFLWSGVAKARSPWITALAVVDYGVVRRPVIGVAWLVAIGELGLAAMLLIAPTVSSTLTVTAAGIATCAFLLFSVLIARALLAGRSFACACFGSGERLTSKTLVRSSVLALTALACATAGPLGPP
ncbi:MAG TPA: MauE/DoxX family redox-associated membrane protein, partial [Thermoleophilaceae bacterium]